MASAGATKAETPEKAASDAESTPRKHDELPGFKEVCYKHLRPMMRRVTRLVHREGRQDLEAAGDPDVTAAMETFYQGLESRSDLSRATTPGAQSEGSEGGDVEVVVSSDESEDDSDGAEVLADLIDDGERRLSTVEEDEEEGDEEDEDNNEAGKK